MNVVEPFQTKKPKAKNKKGYVGSSPPSAPLGSDELPCFAAV